MSSLPDRPNTALLVIDVQNDVVAGTYERDRVIANIAGLVGRARSEGAPVVWVQHSDEDLPKDSDGWQYVPELTRDPSEPLIHKGYGDSFRGHRPRGRSGRTQDRPPDRHGSADRRLHPVDAARGAGPGLRRDPRRGRPHH